MLFCFLLQPVDCFMRQADAADVHLESPEASIHEAATACLHSLQQQLQNKHQQQQHHQPLVSAIAESPSAVELAAVEQLEQLAPTQPHALVQEQYERQQMPSELAAGNDRLSRALLELQEEGDSSKALHQQERQSAAAGESSGVRQ
jgi:heme oxygenase